MFIGAASQKKVTKLLKEISELFLTKVIDLNGKERSICELDMSLVDHIKEGYVGKKYSSHLNKIENLLELTTSLNRAVLTIRYENIFSFSETEVNDYIFYVKKLKCFLNENKNEEINNDRPLEGEFISKNEQEDTISRGNKKRYNYDINFNPIFESIGVIGKSNSSTMQMMVSRGKISRTFLILYLMGYFNK